MTQMKVSQIALMTDEGPQVLPFAFGERVKIKTSGVIPVVAGFRVTHNGGYYDLLLQWTDSGQFQERWVQDCWVEKISQVLPNK